MIRSAMKITIKWGTEGNEEKTYTFDNEHDLKMFMKGVDEANGWMTYYVVEEDKAAWKRLDQNTAMFLIILHVTTKICHLHIYAAVRNFLTALVYQDPLQSRPI